jgi:hypothetical protein
MEPWEKLHDDGCEALVAAIIRQAMQDYVAELKYLKRHPGNTVARQNIAKLRQFFRGTYFSNISGVDGEYLIQRMEKEFKERDGKVRKVKSCVCMNRPPKSELDLPPVQIKKAPRALAPIRGTNIATGVALEFENRHAAAKAMGCSSSTIGTALSGHKPHVKGYRWEYIFD